MYIRWRTYELADRGRSLRAEVVESYRDKTSGQSRVRVLSYLASIRERLLPVPAYRARFWKQAEAKLRLLAISEDDGRKLRETLGRRVPRPDHGRAATARPPARGVRREESVPPRRESPEKELLTNLAVRLGLEL
jgi:hypothetical protein